MFTEGATTRGTHGVDELLDEVRFGQFAGKESFGTILAKKIQVLNRGYLANIIPRRE